MQEGGVRTFQLFFVDDKQHVFFKINIEEWLVILISILRMKSKRSIYLCQSSYPLSIIAPDYSLQ